MVEFGAKSRSNDRQGLWHRLAKSGYYQTDGEVTIKSESLRYLTRDELAEDSASG